MSSSRLLNLGPFGPQVMITRPPGGGTPEVYAVRRSLIAKKEPCQCPRCQWNRLSSRERKAHRSIGACFCLKCEHERDGQIHHTNAKSPQKDKDTHKHNKVNSNETSNTKETNNKDAGVDLPVISDYQRMKIHQMKAEGQNHAKIAAATGLSKQQITLIWEQMQRGKNGQSKKEELESTAATEQANSGKKVEKQQGSKGQVEKLEVKIPAPDKHMSQRDITEASKIINDELSKMWLRVSQRFYTKTGKAFHPDDLEAKFSGQVG